LKVKFIALISSVALSVIPFTPALAAGHTVPKNQARSYLLLPCETADDLDCIDYLGTISDDGSQVQFTVQESKSFPTSSDRFGNTIENGYVNFLSPDKSKAVSLQAFMQSQGFRIAEFNDAMTAKVGAYATSGKLDIHVNLPKTDFTTKVEVHVRTSWLKPQQVGLSAADSHYSLTPIKRGNLWNFEGRQTSWSFYENQNQTKLDSGLPADHEQNAFEFSVGDAGVYPDRSYRGTSYFDNKCSPFGYTVVSTNASAVGVPFWDKGSETLNFNMAAPHLTSKGELNTGFFKFWVSDAYMKCAWPGNTLAKSAKLEVSVTEQDGTPQVSLSSISHKNGKLFVSVDSFHFSQPTIRIGTGKKLKTIKCVKGATKKFVTAIKPACPSGFKISG
jgi:hypothetical protein